MLTGKGPIQVESEMTPRQNNPLGIKFGRDAPPAHPHRITAIDKEAGTMVMSAAMNANAKRKSLGRELSAKAPETRDDYKNMNAVKRFSKNSIVLFPFTGRSKKAEQASSTT